MFAVIKTGGKQYTVELGTRILVEKLDWKEGERVLFEDVLLFDDGGDLHIGSPSVAGVSVEGRIIREVRTPKVIIFKYKPKKRYRKKRGYRHTLGEVEIIGIKKSGAKTPETKVKRLPTKTKSFLKKEGATDKKSPKR